MSRRWLLRAVLLLIVGLVGGSVYASARGRPRQPPAPAARVTPAAHDMHEMHASHTAGFDWGAATNRDLDVANVFLTARRAGVRAAIDSLRAGAARDTELAIMGHVVAHALGRFAVARAQFDPAVFRECTYEFQAGCWHGVMEGYFTSPRAATPAAVAPRALDALCRTIAPAGDARLPRLECAHGMGHGLTARAKNDFRAALASCDGLSDAESRGECHDGVFMEIAVRATEPRAGTDDASLLRPADPRFPCDSVAAEYQPSCWDYQPIVLDELTHDVAKIAQFCARAPEASAAACHHGLGKQSTGWFESEAEVLSVCRRGDARHLGDCVAGAAESYVDESWTPARALTLCRAAPNDAKRSCYAMVGARMSLIHPAADSGRDCVASEPQFADVCRRSFTVVR